MHRPSLIISFALFVVVGTSVDAQEVSTLTDTSGSPDLSTSAEPPDSTSFPIEISISGAGYYQTMALRNYIRPAPVTAAGRFSYVDPTEYPWREDYVGFTDNPLYHAAYYVDVRGRIRPVENVAVEVGIVGEMRGMSYGVRNMKNLAFYPRLLVLMNDTVEVGGEEFTLGAAYGDFEQMTSLLPVAIYNIDVQGGRVSVGWRKLKGTYERIGDMYRGIGLNVEDANQISIGLYDLPIAIRSTARFELGTYHLGYGIVREGLGSVDYFFGASPTYTHSSPRGRLLKAISPSSYGYSALAELTYSDDNGLHVSGLTNVALRGAESSDMLMSRTAFLAAIEVDGNYDDHRFTLDAAYRFYGGLFNAGYRNDEPSYRQPVTSETNDLQFSYTYANSVGPYLYPLSNLDYPFGRWPVYAEYQDLKDVTGWTLYGTGEVDLSERILLEGMLDLNLIVPEKAESAFYPFFSIGLGYRPISSFTASFTLTNRTMNLDKHYPTYYLVDGVIGEVALRWDVGL